MCPLRRVEDADAGPDAVGILVPPGRRTVVSSTSSASIRLNPVRVSNSCFSVNAPQLL